MNPFFEIPKGELLFIGDVFIGDSELGLKSSLGGVLLESMSLKNRDFLLNGCFGLNARVLLLSSFVTRPGDLGPNGDFGPRGDRNGDLNGDLSNRKLVRLKMSFSVRVGVSSLRLDLGFCKGDKKLLELKVFELKWAELKVFELKVCELKCEFELRAFEFKTFVFET